MSARDLAGRLFLAVDLSPALRSSLAEQLAACMPGGRPPGRAVDARLWHLTLKFLGDTEAGAAAGLVRALGRAELGPAFELGFGRAGAFPRPERASVLWIGCEQGQAALAALAAAVESAAVAAGFAAESRPFRAHLTIARLRPPADLRPLLARLPAFVGRMAVRELLLMRSELGRGGPRYEPLLRWPLEAPAPA